MSFWQRAVAIFIVMVFTPVSVLAGTPLRLCVGEDGHRAIEFVLAAGHHGVSQDTDDVADHAVPKHSAAPLSECFDSPLLTAAQTPSLTDQAKVIFSFDNLPGRAVLPALSAFPAPADGFQRALQTRRVLHCDARLNALRTVVLLI